MGRELASWNGSLTEWMLEEWASREGATLSRIERKRKEEEGSPEEELEWLRR